MSRILRVSVVLPLGDGFERHDADVARTITGVSGCVMAASLVARGALIRFCRTRDQYVTPGTGRRSRGRVGLLRVPFELRREPPPPDRTSSASRRRSRCRPHVVRHKKTRSTATPLLGRRSGQGLGLAKQTEFLQTVIQKNQRERDAHQRMRGRSVTLWNHGEKVL
jgi:hypothetical protein